MDYYPNQVDDLTSNAEKLRTKSCIIDKIKLNNVLKNKQQHSYIINPLSAKSTKTLSKLEDGSMTSISSPKSFLSLNMSEKGDDKRKSVEQNLDKKLCESSLSETKIKSMVHMLKNSTKFGANEDLVSYLNNKLNQGFISLKTAFEYIDPDHLGHLLIDEFKIVLEEFNIFVDYSKYEKFLKKYELI
jgi:hypothetical protein